jgi:hypothetical protein
MKVVYTEDALRDLDQILTLIAATYPMITPAFVWRSRTVEWRIGWRPQHNPRHPRSGRHPKSLHVSRIREADEKP